MASLKATVDFKEFNRVLSDYAANSKLTVKEAVAKKFNSVLIEVRKFQLATRPDTLAEIGRVKAQKILGTTKRTKDRMLTRSSKLKQQLQRAQKAIAKGGKRGEKAVFKLLSATAQLQKNTSQQAWSAEVKMRENAAGRAGAWGWRTRGRTFSDISPNDKSARVDKVSTILKSYIEITNKRPDSAEFAARKNIVTRAISGVLADMKEYLERKLSKLK